MSDTKQTASGTAKSGSHRPTVDTATTGTPPPSFVKQAMRNMVRKGSKSLFHFGLTAVGFLGFIVLVAWLGRPTLPQ
jgi:hypothetical protein